MFGIKLNSQFLDIYPNTVFSCVLNSPLYLGDDVDVMTLSLMFTTPLPATPHNQRLLAFPTLLDNAEPHLKEQEATIYVQGIALFRGELEVISAKEREINVRILINFASKLKEMKMKDLDLGTIDITYTNAYTLARNTANEPENYDYVFTPVWNPDFWGIGSPKLDFNNENSLEFQNNWLGPARNSGQFIGQPLTPFPKLSIVLQRIFEVVGLSLNNQFQLTTELKRLLLYSNASMCSKSGEFGILNFNVASGLSDTTPAEFLRHLCRKFALGIFTNWENSEAELLPFKTLINRAAKWNWSKKRLFGYELTYNIDTPSVFGEKYKDTILPEVSKLPTFATDPTDYNAPEGIYTIGQNTWYHKNLVPLDPAVPSQASVRQLTVARLNNYYSNPTAKGNKYENGIGSLRATRLPPFSHASYMPSLKLRGKYEPDETEAVAGEDRLFFYRGMQSYKGNDPFPLASCETQLQDYSGDPNIPISGATHSLDWNGSDGLYEQFWKENMAVLNKAKRVKMQMMLSINDVKNFSFQDKIRIDNQEYLIKTMKLTISRHGLQPSEVELVSVA